jgi:hypothetical protein
VTHLRQLMPDELQRRNRSPSTFHCNIHAVQDFPSTSTARQSASVPAVFASIRCICSEVGSCRLVLSRAVVRLCGFSSSRPFGAPICWKRFLFPSSPGSCRACSVPRK